MAALLAAGALLTLYDSDKYGQGMFYRDMIEYNLSHIEGLYDLAKTDQKAKEVFLELLLKIKKSREDKPEDLEYNEKFDKLIVKVNLNK